MSLHDKICDALTEYFRDYEHLDIKKVTDFEDFTAHDGYCETCYYEYAAVKITYLDSNDKTQTYEYMGTFSELIKAF